MAVSEGETHLDSTTSQRSTRWKALEEGAKDIADALSLELLVGIDPVTVLGREQHT